MEPNLQRPAMQVLGLEPRSSPRGENAESLFSLTTFAFSVELNNSINTYTKGEEKKMCEKGSPFETPNPYGKLCTITYWAPLFTLRLIAEGLTRLPRDSEKVGNTGKMGVVNRITPEPTPRELLSLRRKKRRRPTHSKTRATPTFPGRQS